MLFINVTEKKCPIILINSPIYRILFEIIITKHRLKCTHALKQ